VTASAAPAATDSEGAARIAASRAAAAVAAALRASYCCCDTMFCRRSGSARARSFAARALSACAAATSAVRSPAALACARRWLINASSPGCSSTASVSPWRTVSPSSLSSRTSRPAASEASCTSRISTVPETRSMLASR